MKCVIVASFWIACASAAFAQSDIRGHWSGNLDTPAGAIVIEVDLDKTSTGWIGSASIPAQGATGIPLDSIAFTDGKGSFHLAAGAAGPAFTGTLSADGKTLDGSFAAGPQSLPLKLTRTGDAKVELPKASPAVAAEFVGTWESAINFGAQLRVVVNISNGKNGAEATLTSLDQGNAQIPVSGITQKDSKLTLEVKAIGGGYEGAINKEGTQITGSGPRSA